jgi:hypothetical protein
MSGHARGLKYLTPRRRASAPVAEHLRIFMKELLGATVVLAVLLLSQPVAVAARWDHRPGLQGPDRRQVYQGPERRLPPRYPPGYRGQRPGPERHDGYAGRLTEEERQALRRDVDRANREIYRRRLERR